MIGQIVIYLAAVGILGNGLSAWLLHRDSTHSLNVRGAFLHMVGDMLTSVLVLANGLILIFRPWYWLDPLLSFLIVLFILKNCWSILREATGILMNATPRNPISRRSRTRCRRFPAYAASITCTPGTSVPPALPFPATWRWRINLLSKTEPLSERIRHELFHRFGIDHPILQFETVQCGNGSMLCELSCGREGRQGVRNSPD